MERARILKIMVLALVVVVWGPRVGEASFFDDFGDFNPLDYTDSNSYGSKGHYTISDGKLKITTGADNTFSVMTSDPVGFNVGETLSLDVPGIQGSEGVFMMCSTSAAQPDGISTFGFRFRRDGPGYARMHLYPGGIEVNTADPCHDQPATLFVKRTSDVDFEYSIKIQGARTYLGSFTEPNLSGFSNLHIGSQAYNTSSRIFEFDNLKIVKWCGDWGYHSMDFNKDCYVNLDDFSMFAAHWLECTMPGEPGCVEIAPFRIVIVPDTQIYSANDPGWRKSSRKEVFTQMATWIAQNAASLNIKFVLHMGDIVNDEPNSNQWINANEAMSILDEGNVPYSMAIGNHDMNSNTRNTANFNSVFPYTRFENESWYGGRMEETIQDGFDPCNDYDNAYHYFNAAGMDFLILTLEVGPTDAILNWADSVISSHPNHRVILATHSYMNPTDERDGCFYLPAPCCPNSDPNCSNTGEQVWQKLVRKYENIDFVFSGHQDPSSTSRGFLASIGDHYNVVYQFLCGEWYDGWLRILTFVPQEDRVYIQTYSPWQPEAPNDQYKQYLFSLPGYNTDQYHQYDLHYDMD
jgi:hypothetical protein